MFHNKCLHTLKQIFFKKEKKERQKLWLKVVEDFVPWFLSPSLEKSLRACWGESVLRCGSLGAEQGWSVLVETDRRRRVNGLEVRTLKIQAGNPKLRDTKAHRLKGRSWELEGYRRYGINNLGDC